MNKPMKLLMVLLCTGCAVPLDPNVRYVVEACEKHMARMDQESRDRIKLCESSPDIEECKDYPYQMMLYGTIVRNELGLWKENDLVAAFHALGITHPESMSAPIMEGITAANTCDPDVINHEIQKIRESLGVIDV